MPDEAYEDITKKIDEEYNEKFKTGEDFNPVEQYSAMNISIHYIRYLWITSGIEVSSLLINTAICSSRQLLNSSRSG